MIDNVLVSLPENFSFILGLVHIEKVEVRESEFAFREIVERFCADLLNELASQGKKRDGYKPELRDAVRALLRQGGFKPSGRNRPANEFLLRQLIDSGGLNFILNLVDINNFLSLKHFLPMSVLDANKFKGCLTVRLGIKGERYIFNQSQQEIDLEGLIVLANKEGDSSIALGSPVKDSMEGKVNLNTSSILTVVYAPTRLIEKDKMQEILCEWSSLSEAYSKAKGITSRILSNKA